MKANEFIRKYGYVDSKEYINRAHKKATHLYIGFMGTASYFYQHPNLNWREVDSRTIGWESDRCCYGVHPPISSMFIIEELKRLLESWELIDSLGGLNEAKKRLQQANEEFSLLISFKNKSGDICSVYDHVLTKAIADAESCL